MSAKRWVFQRWSLWGVIVAFIDTVKKDRDVSLQERYEEFLRYSVPNREVRRKLSEEHDVKPRELDGIIRNQSGEQNRSLVELVSNAIDYSEEGGAVDVELQESGFTVKDSGKGMSPKQIFERLLIPKSSGSAAEEDNTIGRFGMGFYTALSHL